MKANYKAPALDAMLSVFLGGASRPYYIERGWCTICDCEGIPTHDEFFEGGYWKDAKSLDEYKISGICQGCQDEIFTEEG